jgi:hypothetical protein
LTPMLSPATVAAMAVKSHSRSKTRAKKAKSNGHAAKDYEVITLRIARQHKAKLLDHCAKRAKQEGKQMSFNRAIIEWIQGL